MAFLLVISSPMADADKDPHFEQSVDGRLPIRHYRK
jgi:hypothetical protein